MAELNLLINILGSNKFLKMGVKLPQKGKKRRKNPGIVGLNWKFSNFLIIFLLLRAEYTILQIFSPFGAFLRILGGGVVNTPPQVTERSRDPRLDRVN